MGSWMRPRQAEPAAAAALPCRMRAGQPGSPSGCCSVELLLIVKIQASQRTCQPSSCALWHRTMPPTARSELLPPSIQHCLVYT